MKIIAGLGNPGPKYETTRHNVGFLAVDRLVDHWKASGPNSKSGGEVFQASFENESILLVKPKTYMNLSGRCIGPLVHFYQCKPEDLIVIHDELDLPAMTLRLKTGGGTGGHNGLKSIDEHLGKGQLGYHRIRIGIGHPSTAGLNRNVSPADYVLMPFQDEELSALDSVLNDVIGATEEILRGRIQTAMNKYHRSK
jgi:PTH1 family peptidyl-tRNA hydrolase